MSKARCKNCGDVIESKHRHDFVTCGCYDEDKNTGIFLDGGDDYVHSGGNLEHFELIKDNEEQINES